MRQLRNFVAFVRNDCSQYEVLRCFSATPVLHVLNV